MKCLVFVVAVLAVASASPERQRRSLLGLGHNGAVVLGGVVPGVAVAPAAALLAHAAPSVAVLGPSAGSAAVVGPAVGSAAVVGPSAGSAAVVGPSAGSAAIVGPSVPSTVVAGPAGAVVAPGVVVGGHGHLW